MEAIRGSDWSMIFRTSLPAFDFPFPHSRPTGCQKIFSSCWTPNASAWCYQDISLHSVHRIHAHAINPDLKASNRWLFRQGSSMLEAFCLRWLRSVSTDPGRLPTIADSWVKMFREPELYLDKTGVIVSTPTLALENRVESWTLVCERDHCIWGHLFKTVSQNHPFRLKIAKWIIYAFAISTSNFRHGASI